MTGAELVAGVAPLLGETGAYAASAVPEPIGALAFATDAASEAALTEGLAHLENAQVWGGGLRACVDGLRQGATAPLVFADLDGEPYPAGALYELAAVCEEGTAVVAFGTDATASHCRTVLLAGVAEYLVKPLAPAAVREAAERAAAGDDDSVKLASGLAAGAGAGLWASGSELVGQYGFLVALAALAGFVVGGVVPEYALRMRIARRARAMGAALPDALDLTVMGLESGLTFERTLVTVAEELRPIEPNLANELGLMEAELRVGAERRTVLEAFQQRSRVEGLKDLAMTLIQSERFGTPLTQSMKNIAANERTQRAARIETAAQRLPVLMTLPMLMFVVPGTMCLVAGPAFLTAIQALGSLAGG